MESSRDDFIIAIRSAFLNRSNQQRFSLLSLVFISIIFLILGNFNFRVIYFAKNTIRDIVYASSFIVSIPENNIKKSYDKISGHFKLYDDYQNDFKSEMNKVFYFLEIEKVEINSEKKHMVGGWQWEDEKMKNIMMKKNPIKSFLKVLIPFKGIRKNIRTKIQNRNTSKVPEICKDDIEMLRKFYKEDVKQLSVLLERNLNHWTE